MDQQEFLNAYIQRMLALNSELTNKNVMIETRFMLLEKKYTELVEKYNAMVLKYEPPINTEGDNAVAPEQPKSSKDEQF